MSEPQYGDQGAPAQHVPDADTPGDPEPESVGPDETSPEETQQVPPEPVDETDDAVAEPDLSAAAPTRVEHTGNPVVDSVLDSLEELDRLPPAEHVAVFEAAHERLRGALSDAGEPPAES